MEGENSLGQVGCQRESAPVCFEVFPGNVVHCNNTKLDLVTDTSESSVEAIEKSDCHKDNFPINGKVLYPSGDNGLIISNCLGACAASAGENEPPNISSKINEKSESCIKSVIDKEPERDTSSVESDRTDISILSDSFSSMKLKASSFTSDEVIEGIQYVVYESELQMSDIMRLITKDLSEPYSIYTYRYFIHNWPKLCFLNLVIFGLFPINGKVLYPSGDNGLIISNCLGACAASAGENEPPNISSKINEKSESCIKSVIDKEPERDTSSVESDRTDISILSDSFSSMKLKASSFTSDEVIEGIQYVVYESELQMSDIMRLITKDLSEPYSIYTYRYFIHNWPKLCFLAMDGDKCVGAIVCKLDMHKKMVRRGYIAMLAIDAEYRRRKIGSNLVLKAIRAMILDDCDEVVLETEITNKPALRLYENLGFVRDKRLFRYYLNGVDALRLKLWLR